MKNRFDLLGVFKKHRGAVWVALGMGIGEALGAIMWMVLALLLVPGEYGYVSYLISMAMLASFITPFGLTITITTYYPKERKKRLIGESYFFALLTSFGAAVILTGLGWLLSSPLDGALTGLIVICISLFWMATYTELGRRRYWDFMWVYIVAKSLGIFLSIGLYFMFGLPGVILGYSLAHLMPSLRPLGRPRISFRFGEIKKHLNFTYMAFGGEVAKGLISWLDKVVIGIFFGAAMLGIYQISFQIFALILFIPTTLFLYLLPEKSIRAETKKIETIGILLSAALALAAFAFAPILIPRILPRFAESVVLIQIMAFAAIPAAIGGVEAAKLYAKEKSGAVLVSRILATLGGLISLIILGGYFGSVGLAASMILLQTILAATLYAFRRNIQKITKHEGQRPK